VREATEDEMAGTIARSVAGVRDVSRSVFNFHCPPKDTLLDRCVKVEVVPGELPRPVREAGRFVMTGGGSVAVRESIEQEQPLVALHGHIHESPGATKIGHTHCLNPGSEYGEGIFRGYLVEIDRDKVVKLQRVES
jgi:Icc-related predicted phosphoesterase